MVLWDGSGHSAVMVNVISVPVNTVLRSCNVLVLQSVHVRWLARFVELIHRCQAHGSAFAECDAALGLEVFTHAGVGRRLGV